MKKILNTLLFLFITGVAFSQTTVTLQDQCNCEVLSGTDVSAPGATTPTGADTGDIYVNTSTGAIFYWDGDSWEFTSGNDSNTTNASLTEDGINLILTDSDANTVSIPLASIAAVVDTNTTNVTFQVNGGTGQLEIIDSDGNTVFVSLADLAAAVDTDDQTAAEVTYDNSTSGLTATDIQSALDEVAAGSTDDQTVSTDGTAGNISIENGNSITLNVDDADPDPTNEYNTGIAFDGTNLTLTDGGGNQTIDISGVSTDDQTAAEVSIADAGGNFTATDVEGALSELAAGSTDDQQLDDTNTTFNAGTNVLTVALEDGGTATADLSALDNSGTDDQTAAEVSIADAGGNFTATDVEGALSELAAGSTDDQQLDDTNTAFNAGTNVLTVALEDGGTATADLSALDNSGTDDQTAAEVSIADAGGNFTATDVEGALSELAAGSTDDQQLDDTNTAFNAGTNVLTVALEDGGTATADLSALDNSGTDDQTAVEVSIADAGGNFTATDVEGALSELAAGSTDDQTLATDGTAGNISIEDGNSLTINVNDSDSDATNEFNTGSGITAGSLEITDGGGTESVNLISTDANNDLVAGTDGALYLNVASVSIAETNTTLSFDSGTNALTYTNELGNNPAIDLSSLDDSGTDDQTAAEVSIADAGGNFTATDVEGALSELAAGSTDDQQLDDTNTAFNAGTNVLTVALENGGTATADLSALDNSGTDDQTAAEVSIADAGGNFTATDVEGALSELAAGSTDDQQLDDTNTTFNAGTNVLTVALEDGGTATADLSALDNSGTDDQTAAEVSIADAGGNFTATDVEGALSELAAGSTDDQQLDDTNTAFNAGTNVLTVALEDGGTATANLSALDNSGTDDQTAAEVSIADAGGNFTATDVEGALSELAAGSTDDQQLDDTNTAFNAGTNVLTVALEDGGTATADLSALDNTGTDDQTAAEVTVADAGGNFTNTEVEGVLEEIDARIDALVLAGGSDGNDFVTGGSLSGTDLTLNVPNQVDPVIDLSGLQDGTGTDDQQLDDTNTAFNAGTNVLTVALEDGGTATADLSALDNSGTDDQTAAEVSIADAGGNFTATDVEGALSELAAGSTDDQQLDDTNTAFNAGTNVLTVALEDGGTATADLSALDNSGTDDQTAAEVSIADAGGNFTATDVEGALSELAAGSTDDQQLDDTNTAFNAGTNVLTVALEDGGTATADLSALDNPGTDDQTAAEVSIADAGGNFTATDVEGALSELAAGSTDDQQLDDTNTAFNAGTNVLTVALEDGGTATADLSALDNSGTDDQTAAEVSIADAGGNFTATDVEGALSELAAGSTDDQQLDDTNTAFNTGTNVLTVALEDGGTATADLSALDNSGTDDQTAAEVSIADAGGNFTATDVEGALSELAAGSTDDQQLDDTNTSFNAGTNVLTVALEDGGTATADLSALDDSGTDDQQLDDPNTTFNTGTNVLTVALEDGGTATADLSALDNSGTDDQTAAEVSIADAGGNFTATDVEGALSELAAGSTDDQQLDDTNTTFNAGTNVLTVALEDGGTATADLSALDNSGTDDQTAAEVTVADAGGNFTNTEVEGVLEEIDARIDALVLAGGSDGNDFVTGGSLSGTDLTLNVPNQVDPVIDLSGLQDGTGTDDQQLDDTNTAFNAGTNVLTVALEDGGTATADLSALDNSGTDDQTAAEVSIADAGGNFTATDVEGALSELAAGSTDDQQLDDTNTAFNAGTNVLTVALEDGGTATADLSALDNSGTDDQTAAEVSIADAGGNFTATDVEGALSELAAGSTDDQQLDDTNTTFNAGTNVLTVALEDGGTATADLSALDNSGTDDQTAAEVSIADAGGNFTATDVEGALSELAAGSTDDQQLDDTNTAFNAGTNVLTVALEDGGTATADLSALDNSGTDDQTAAEVSIADAGGNFTATDVEGALSELAAGSTDDQQLDDTNTAFNAGTNVLTVALEDGGTATADLSALDNSGTDDQTAAEVSIADAGGNFTATDVEGALSELAAGSTDDQQLDDTNTAFNTGTNVLTVALEDGGTATADLSALDNSGTDDQTAAEVSIADAGGNFTATDVEGALSELAAGSTDDQQLDDTNTSFNAGTNVLTVALEDGGTATADLSALDDSGTDDQQLDDPNTTFNTGTNVLTVALEDGGTATADLSALDNSGTDDQTAAEVSIADAGGNFTATDVEGALSELAAGSTDDQQLDDTNTAFNAGTNVLTVALEDGGTATANLSALDNSGTDDQTAAEVSIADAGGNFTATDVEGALSELAAGSTDDQQLDDTNTAFNAGTNVLTVALEDGGTATADLSALDNSGTDDQTAAEVSIADAGGNFTATDVEGALSELAAGSTDDQQLDDTNTAFNAGTNVLTVALEDGGTATADLSALDNSGTDDQTAAEVSIADAGGNFTATDVEGALSELAAGSTDDQQLDDTNTAFNAGTNVLTVALEDGGTATADLSALDNSGTDDQTAAEVSIADAGGNFTATDVEGALSELAAGSTDDQQLDDTNTAFNAGTNVLTVALEDGGTATADLSALDNSGTDDQTAAEVSIADAGGNFTATDVEGALSELAAGSTDDQEADEVNLATNVDLDEDGTDETTVQAALSALDAMPKIYATGKVEGTGTAVSIYGATVSRIDEGDYQITFSTALSNANYIIQVATLDCGGDCPGNTGANYDDPGISYYNQATTGFRVNIGDSDNGTTQKDDIDLEFMFTVIVIP